MSDPDGPPLDPIDRRILAALSRAARVTNAKLAEAAGIAPSTCLERVRRLERAGVLAGYRAVIPPRAVGLDVEALVAVRLSSQARAASEAFRDQAAKIRGVLRIYHTTGPADAVLHVVVAHGAGLRDLLGELAELHGVERVEASPVFERTDVSLF